MPMQPQSCHWCNEPGAFACGRLRVCARHRRSIQMRDTAKRSGKAVPTHAELEAMFRALIGMRCPVCCVVMNWLGRDGRRRVVTLQHDRGGTLRLSCVSCDVVHRCRSGDTFYDDRECGMGLCCLCNTWKRPD